MRLSPAGGRARRSMDSASSAAVGALERRVGAALGEHGLEGKRLLVAVSGGPDSMALLHALYRLRDEYRLTLCGAHLNHRLRGRGFGRRRRVRGERVFSELLGIPYTVDSADVAAYRGRHRLSLEDAARRVRYAFLADAAHEARRPRNRAWAYRPTTRRKPC